MLPGQSISCDLDLPLANRQQGQSRTLQTAEFFTDLTLMCLNLLLFPPSAGDFSSRKPLLRQIITDYSLLLEYVLSFYIRKCNTFELFTFFQICSPHMHTLGTSTPAKLFGGHFSWKMYVIVIEKHKKGILLLALSLKR